MPAICMFYGIVIYQLIIDFADGSKKQFDARSLLQNPYYKKLIDLHFFMKAYVDGPTVAWNDMLDIAPETLYNNSIPLA